MFINRYRPMGGWGGSVILVRHNLSIIPPVEHNFEHNTLVSRVTPESIILYFSSIIRQTLFCCWLEIWKCLWSGCHVKFRKYFHGCLCSRPAIDKPILIIVDTEKSVQKYSYRFTCGCTSLVFLGAESLQPLLRRREACVCSVSHQKYQWSLWSSSGELRQAQHCETERSERNEQSDTGKFLVRLTLVSVH